MKNQGEGIEPERFVVAPVIMSGGSGSRLWPLSTPRLPKQFRAFQSPSTLLQETARRVIPCDGLDVTAPIVVCSLAHERLVREQLAAVDVRPDLLILEPFGRNTAAVAVLAARLAARRTPGALVLLMPADHVVADAAAFRDAVRRGAAVCRDRLVTFGVRPTRPETGYGYIHAGEPLSEGVSAVARFVEKPGRAAAEAYIADGGYLWNAGVFLFAPRVMLAEMTRYRPDIVDAVDAALALSQDAADRLALDDAAFARCPSDSVDKAVMEHSDRVAVTPFEAGWADIGSWDELWRLSPKSPHGNVEHGALALDDVHDALIWAEDVPVAVVGVSDLLVVVTPDGVLVAPRSRAQDVRALAERARALG